MSVGPCGMACTSCREHVDGRCAGCVRGDALDPARAAISACTVLRCSAARSVAYCLRDCPDFPCSLHLSGQPFCQTRAATHDRRVPFPEGAAPTSVSDDGATVPVSAPLGLDDLRVHLLGRFRVFVGEREIGGPDWGQGRGPSEKVKGLFAVLTVRDSHGVRRDTLTDVLWPEQTDPDRAKSCLHLAMHCLRHALEPDRPKGSPSRFVSFDGLRYRLIGHDACWIDADEFEGHCTAAALAARIGDVGTAVQQWTMAAGLYVGDYLTGISAAFTEDGVHDWCLPRRESLRAQYVAAITQLAGYYVAQGDPDTALRLARHALQAEPDSAEAHHLAERSLVAAGQITAAQVQRRLRAARGGQPDRGAAEPAPVRAPRDLIA